MRLLIGPAAAVAAVLFAAAPAGAGDGRDRVHADSFGNLVIHSSAGYKRIIVGMGEVAESYRLTGSYYEPETMETTTYRAPRRCWRPPHVWHGRSYMYGLRDGEMPRAPLVCE